ncbi:MAG: hypothetical protein KGQ87_03615 [Verrucomicrobia bacterium]|nr:hypothetical protein [Verrucomicrobiota bacterium]
MICTYRSITSRSFIKPKKTAFRAGELLTLKFRLLVRPFKPLLGLFEKAGKLAAEGQLAAKVQFEDLGVSAQCEFGRNEQQFVAGLYVRMLKNRGSHT